MVEKTYEGIPLSWDLTLIGLNILCAYTENHSERQKESSYFYGVVKSINELREPATSQDLSALTDLINDIEGNRLIKYGATKVPKYPLSVQEIGQLTGGLYERLENN